MHGIRFVLFGSLAYIFAAHSLHLSELAYLPTEQLLQLAQTRAPMAPDISVPALQTAHAVLLFSPSVYFPGLQSPQEDFLESALNVYRGQSSQSLDLSFPVLAENVPGGQSLHPVSAHTPVAEEYVPAGQFLHVVSAIVEGFARPLRLKSCSKPTSRLLAVPTLSRHRTREQSKLCPHRSQTLSTILIDFSSFHSP